MIEQSSPSIPSDLKLTQEWFASIITSPLLPNNFIQDYTPQGNLVAEESSQYVVPSPTLKPHQRMQIYNQQYWWRLLNTLHANFPLVTRLFGYYSFNEEIGVPYLLKHPPYHWSLHTLGDQLEHWIKHHYHKADQLLVYQAAQLDWAFMASFIAPQCPLLDLAQLIQEQPDALLNHTFYLQPCLYLFSWDDDLLAFRHQFLKHEIDYWANNRFPELLKEKTYRFILYRNIKNNISWKELSQAELLLLERFKNGTTLNDAFEYIEKQKLEVYEEVTENLQEWLQKWTQMGWLTLTPPSIHE